MRLLAALITLGFLGLAGLAGHALWVMSGLAPAQASSILISAQPQATQRPRAATDAATAAQQPPAAPRFWPALFGEPQPPVTQNAPPPPTSAPPSPPKPPLASLGYSLKGVVRTETAVWATVDHPSGGRLLRQGDELEPNVIVTRIDEDGVWVSRYDDTPELLGFTDAP